MPLAPNSKLGPYEIKSTLGVGGMGEVYRARDSRLNRDVAIKVLREDGSSADLRSRFEREARAVAALNHPNIVSVYDFGVESGQQYIVSELLEGESLRFLLHGKPIPVRKLIDIGTQIADGLAAAHSASIVHRDLKPENIMLGKDGRVKILDFGLARQARATGTQRRATGAEDTVAPADETQHLTSEGAVMGTAGYMSPEQALGREVDYRSDQFSFGLILHEMASGKQAFARNSSVETMAAIVRDEPSPIEEKIPPPLKWIIDRCLHKEPEQRYESTRDLFHELKNLREHFSEAYSSSGVLAPVPAQSRTFRWKLLAGVAAACLLAVAVVIYALRPVGQSIGSYQYTPFASDASRPVWSPDGKAVAYMSDDANGISRIFLRYLNSPVPTQLSPDKEDSYLVGWSSDRTHILVAQYPDFSTMKLMSIPIFGGEAEHIMDILVYGYGGEYGLSPDGKILAILRRSEDGSIHLWISDPVGTPLREYLPAPFVSHHLFGAPQVAFSPNGRNIFLSRSGDLDLPEMWLLPYPIGSGQPKKIYSKLEPGYTPHLGWMPDNRHAVLSLNLNNEPDHLWIADTGSESLQPLTHGPHIEREPAISPDGKTLIYSEYTRQFDIASVSVEDGSATILPTAGHLEHKPAWAANQQKLTWVSERSGLAEIWVRNTDGSERPVVTTRDFSEPRVTLFENPSLSPEGDRIIYGTIDVSGVTKLWVSSLAGGPPVRVTNSPSEAVEFSSGWSPDGKRYMYLQAMHGDLDLMLVRTNGNATPVQLKRVAQLPFLSAWSPTGEWITYEDENGWGLISPDGKNEKPIGKLNTWYLEFSKDGKTLYGIDRAGGHAALFRLDIASGKKTVIKELGKEWMPSDDLYPSIRFSLSPDGKNIVYAVSRTRNDLWMLQGYRQPGLWNQIKDAFHFGSSK
jgi:serine/threonine protein kinase/WD40 repeat protein